MSEPGDDRAASLWLRIIIGGLLGTWLLSVASASDVYTTERVAGLAGWLLIGSAGFALVERWRLTRVSDAPTPLLPGFIPFAFWAGLFFAALSVLSM